jgi:hypothetical protein
LSEIYIANNFSTDFFLMILTVVCNEQKSLILVKLVYIVFPLWLELFVSCLRILCLSKGHQDTLLLSSLLDIYCAMDLFYFMTVIR